MARKTTKLTIISWLLTLRKKICGIYENRIFYAILVALQKFVDPDKCGKHIPHHLPTDLYGDILLEIPLQSCLKNPEDHNHMLVYKALTKLATTGMWIQGEKEGYAVTIIQKPKHVLSSSVITLKVDIAIAEALMDYTNHYRALNASLACSFDSVYTMRLYEIVAGVEFVATRTLQHYRQLFDLETKYKDNTDFLRFTFDVAKAELDAKSPWSFNYKRVVKDRRIHAIEIAPYKNYANDPARQARHDYQQVLATADIKKFPLLKMMIQDLGFTHTEISSHIFLLQEFREVFDPKDTNALISYGRSLNWMDNPKGGFIKHLQRYVTDHQRSTKALPTPTSLVDEVVHHSTTDEK